METKDLNSIGLAYLQMVEKRNTEAKKNHANALHKNQKALDVHSDEDEDHNDDPTDGDGDIDAADLKKLRADADKDDKKFDKKKKSSKKDDGDDQEKFKAYTGDDKNDQEGTKVSEDKEDKFEPHMMYDPKTGKGYKAEKEEIDEAMTMVSRKPHPEGGHIVTLKDKNDKKVVRHLHNGKVKTISKESVEIDEATDLQEGAARQAALAKGLMDYCKEIGKDHMDHKDFADHAKHVKAGNWDKARAHADDQDTEVREKIHTLAIDHLGQGAASELYGGDRKLSKNKGDGKLHASYNESVNVDEATIPDGQTAMTKKPELTKKDKKTMGKIADLMKTANESVNVDDVLALIDQGYTLDQAEAMVAEACGGGTSAPVINSSKKTDDKKLLKASRKQSKAGDNDRNMANDQRSIPAKGADTAPVRPGTKQNQRDFDKAARMAKSKDKVSVAKAPWESVEVDEGSKEGTIRIIDLSDAHPDNRMGATEKSGFQVQRMTKGKFVNQGKPYAKKAQAEKERSAGQASMQFEGVMDRVSNMVEGIRVNIQEKKEINEGPGDINNPMKGMTGGWQGSGPAEPMRVKTMSKKREKELRAAGKLSNSANNASHYAGEAVQEAAKPTAIHHSTPVTAAQANDEQAAGRWTDKAGRNTMTEKEFVDMHTIHPDVLPEFDGNVAAKKTAEAIKKAPKVSPTPNKNPTAGDKNKVKSTEAPAANTAVVGESYMDKYAKYIRGEI